jgi:hypothetical protein
MLLARGLAYILMISPQVLEYGQSEYVRQFGMNIPDQELLGLEARIIKAPALRYNPASRQPKVELVCASSPLMMK